jgi:hypothetical protein
MVAESLRAAEHRQRLEKSDVQKTTPRLLRVKLRGDEHVNRTIRAGKGTKVLPAPRREGRSLTMHAEIEGGAGRLGAIPIESSVLADRQGVVPLLGCRCGLLPAADGSITYQAMRKEDMRPTDNATAVAVGLCRTGRAVQHTERVGNVLRLERRGGGYYWISFDSAELRLGETLLDAEPLQSTFTSAMARARRTPK